MKRLGMILLVLVAAPIVWIALAGAGWWAFFAGIGLAATTAAIVAGLVGGVELMTHSDDRALIARVLARLGSGALTRR